MQEVIDREGRDAKNLLVYQFCEQVASTNNNNLKHEKPEHRKPPKSPNSLNASHTPKKARSPSRLSSAKSGNSGPRVRSASTDRDKRTELQARYWALLFGNLQRAVNEIYQTVECYENISSCQEAILVLENYVRDFKALGEWFKVSWDYDSRPVQQRPQSLAWEIRKSNPAPRVRAKSLSSPSPTSGKSSPCHCNLSSGKSSPCCANYEQLTPRKCLRAGDSMSKCAMHVSVRELFASNKAQQQVKQQSGQQLHQQQPINFNGGSFVENSKQACVEPICNTNKPQIETEPIFLPNRQHQYAQTDLEDDHLTLADIREKLHQEEQAAYARANECYVPPGATIVLINNENVVNGQEIIHLNEPTAVEWTVQKLNAMEDALLNAYATKPATSEEFTVLKPAVDALQPPTPALVLPVLEINPADASNIVVENASDLPLCEQQANNTPAATFDATSAQSSPTIAANVDTIPIVLNPVETESSSVVPTSTTVADTLAKTFPTTVAVVDASKKPPAAVYQQNGPLKYSSVLNRPATRSSLTAKPAHVTAATTASNNSSTTRASSLTKMSTNSTMKSTNIKRSAQQTSVVTKATRGGLVATNRFHYTAQNLQNGQTIPPRPSSKTESYAYGPPTNVAARLSTRSRTMVEMNGGNSGGKTSLSHPKHASALSKRHPWSTANSRKSSREDIGSSTSTLKASNEHITPPRNQNQNTHDERHSEPKQLPTTEANDGWFTVKNRRRSSMHWSNRFDQPTGYASLPTLTLLIEKKSDPYENSQVGEQSRPTSRLRAVRKTEKAAAASKTNGKANAKEKLGGIKMPVITAATTLASKQQRNKQTSVATASNNQQKSTKVVVTRPGPEIKNAKAKVNSLPPQRKNANQSEKRNENKIAVGSAAATGKDKSAPTPAINRTSFIKRQKSDITGLKMTSLHEEYMRSEQKSHVRKNQTMSALALATENSESRDSSMGASSTETIIDASKSEVDKIGDQGNAGGDCGDQNKIHIKIQTNRDFSKTIGDLYESIATMSKSRFFMNSGDLADQNVVKLENHRLPCCEEDEDELDVTLTNEMFDCDEHQRLLVEEQESLERQIRELESTEIDVDTETDETDCEVALDHDENDDDVDIRKLEEMQAHHLDDPSAVVFVSINDEGSNKKCTNFNDENADDDPNSMSLETRYQDLFSEMSFGERVEALATLEAYVARHPGRAQELHQKLSSPSRRRSLHETLKKYQAKQARAQEKRELLQKEKAVKIQHLLTRVEDVKAARLQIIEEKRQKMEDRLQRAAENREQYLRQIIEKAHDEEKKLKEINFIKNIEAQNKRLDWIESSKDAEGRLQDLELERQKRSEEKAAKEAAVERRRQELEKERQRKLERMEETRLERETRIEKMQEQKERQRQALAAEKARDREERLLALQVQQQQTTEELQRKILQKQQESARRHEENMEHIRQRALELTMPTRNQDENVNGELGNGTADGELSSSVSESSVREHSRNFKKKMKKLKQRMAQCAEEYLSKEQQPVPAHMKRDSQVPKYLNLITKGGGSQGMERALLQLMRLISKAQIVDFQCFLVMDGLGTVTQHVILDSMQDDSEISKKALVLAVQLYRNACSVCPQIARHAILGNSLAGLFDLLAYSLQLPEEKSPQHPVELSTELMLACTVALSPSYGKKHTHPKTLERLPDLISYAVISGLIETLSRRCLKIRESVESQKSVILSLLATLGLLTKFIDVCQPGPTDSTRLFNTAKSTEMFGAISMLYASVVPVGECIPPRTVSLAAATFNLLVSMAVLDLSTFQETLTTESLALKYLDVITILLKYCGTKEKILKNPETQAMIIDLIASIGFYCANNRKHQDLLTSEQCAIIIKSLTKLPEQFQAVVYPCLVTITFHNQNARNVIARDFNLDFLDEYHKSDMGKKNHLVCLLKT